MRHQRGRKKKLIVAFQFQFSNQAGWKCDDCRRQGLERKRRCGWASAADEPVRVVWARGSARLTTCPKSYVTPQSLEWVEKYQVLRVFGFDDLTRMPARDVDAFCVLEMELIAERKRDQE